MSWEKQKFVQGKSFGFRDKNLSREKVGFRDKNLSLILSRKNLSSKKSVLDELLVTFSLSVHSLNGGASYDTKIGFFGLYSISLSGSSKILILIFALRSPFKGRVHVFFYSRMRCPPIRGVKPGGS